MDHFGHYVPGLRITNQLVNDKKKIEKKRKGKETNNIFHVTYGHMDPWTYGHINLWTNLLDFSFNTVPHLLQ